MASNKKTKTPEPKGPPKKMFEKRGLDLTRRPGNPAFELRQVLESLAGETVPELFIARVKGVVKPMVGHGVSEENYKRMLRAMDGCVENYYPHANPIEALQDYIWRGFILKAAGMGVFKNGSRR